MRGEREKERKRERDGHCDSGKERGRGKIERTVSVLTFLPVFVSHSLMVLSHDPDASKSPGPKATLHTWLVCP